MGCRSLLLLLMLGVAAADLAIQRPPEDCLNSPVMSVNEFTMWPEEYRIQSIADPEASPDKASVTVMVADDFTVTYHKTFKVVTNKRANETYVLYQCGSPNPTTQPPGTVLGLPPKYKVFSIPLVSIAADQTTSNGFMKELGVADRVAYSSQYSVDECLQKVAAIPAVSGCGNSSVAAAPVTDPAPGDTPQQLQSKKQLLDKSAKQAAATDAILTSTASSNPEAIAFSATSDPGALNRAEWIKFLAPFFNKELEANKVFDDIRSSYTATKDQAAAILASNASREKSIVAWVSHSSIEGDEGIFSLAPYKVQFIKDAGGKPLTREEILAVKYMEPSRYDSANSFTFNTTKFATNLQQLHELLNKADVIIDESYQMETLDVWKEKFGITAPGQVKAVDALQVYTLSRSRGASMDGNAGGDFGSDWFETAVVRPDEVLLDFTKVLNTTTEEIDQNKPKYLYRLGGVAVDAPVVTDPSLCTAVDCKGQRMPFAICPNVYRDCDTGKLMQAKPSERCDARPTCPAPVPLAGTDSKVQNTGGSNGGSVGSPFRALVLSMGGAALAALLLL